NDLDRGSLGASDPGQAVSQAREDVEMWSIRCGAHESSVVCPCLESVTDPSRPGEESARSMPAGHPAQEGLQLVSEDTFDAVQNRVLADGGRLRLAVELPEHCHDRDLQTGQRAARCLRSGASDWDGMHSIDRGRLRRRG